MGNEVPARDISIHALREEGDLSRMAANLQQIAFLSTPSARRATASLPSGCSGSGISIHALREEGDLRIGMRKLRMQRRFLSTPSARRATIDPEAGRATQFHFYPRPPRGGRPMS